MGSVAIFCAYPLYLKSVRKLQEKRFVFVKILAIIIPENGAKVSKIKCFQFAQQTLIKERLGHEKIQTTLGTYGHLYPNTNVEVARKLTGVLTYTPATTSVADYTSNQHTAIYHRAVE